MKRQALLHLKTAEGLSRIWYWPPWQLSEWWKVYVTTGGDEYDRRTLMIHLGPLGCVIVATSRSGYLNWRCGDCRCLNSPQHWCCHLCGAGHPEDA